MPGDPVWTHRPGVLLERWREFFPGPDQTAAERVNSIVRLCLYCSVAVYLYNRRLRYVAFGAGAAAAITAIYATSTPDAEYADDTRGAGAGKTRACTLPTPQNPFANLLLTEVGKGRPGACRYDDVRDEITRNFNIGMPRDVRDFDDGRNTAQRAFYTMPVTTDVPDMKAYSNFMYGSLNSCKENQAMCGTRTGRE